MNDTTKKVSRRAVLARLGLAAGAIYAAPVLLQLGEAKASSFSGRGRRRDGWRRPIRGDRRSFSRRSFSRRSFSR
jgi:hypothetical protein